MLITIMLASAAAQSSPPSAAPIGSARSVIEAQLQSAPRVDDQMSPEEADIVQRKYLESIGKPAEGSRHCGKDIGCALDRKYDIMERAVEPRP
ncbi:hypothetical protein EIK56_24865 [Sphingomonas sp. C8-2]|nr:hypothetical protein [Sphingomonas sp. Y57]QEH81139.1 hypothetical protein EIK56_24865 [Sphingomonas sp. C8-2]